MYFYFNIQFKINFKIRINNTYEPTEFTDSKSFILASERDWG